LRASERALAVNRESCPRAGGVHGETSRITSASTPSAAAGSVAVNAAFLGFNELLHGGHPSPAAQLLDLLLKGQQLSRLAQHRMESERKAGAAVLTCFARSSSLLTNLSSHPSPWVNISAPTRP